MRRSNGSIAPWSFVNGNKPVEAIVSGPLIAHDFPTILGAAVEGVGLAQVPEPIAASLVRAGKLVHVPVARANGAMWACFSIIPATGNNAEAASLHRSA